MSKNLLSLCFIKEGTFKPSSLGGSQEIKIRELTIAESEEFRNIFNDKTKTQRDAMFYAVKCAMVEPVFFSDEELEKLNITGLNLIQEIYGEIPLIGKTKKERDDYFKKIKETIEKNSSESKDEIEEAEKK